MEMDPHKLTKVITLTVFLSALFLLPAYSYPSELGDLRISLIDGDVQIKTIDTGDWVPASINEPLMDGDILWVPEDGKAAIQVKDGSYVRLDENTSLEVLTLEKNSYQFYLTTGHAYVNFKATRGSFLQVDTPLSSIRAYDLSIFRVDVGDNDLTRISVIRGKVDAESDGGRTTVNFGNTLALGRDHYAEVFPLGQPDQWDRWNTEKDRRLESRASARYLPDELRPYSSDFDENGKWVYEREYGYVWRPTVVVSVDWAPYRVGRWVWMRGDYVWVSYEPWGWAPYHYGRWAFGVSIGWFWVPPIRGAVYWGPGFVGWVYTPTYVSWVPLAPREIYYGHGHYGPHSVNITKVNVTNINVTKIVYKNVHVHNSVTVLHHDTFVRGKHMDVKVKENPFLREKINIGRPDIKPEKPTRMPAVREIPDRKRPPEKVRQIQVKETQERRPLAKQRNDSVLTPGKPPKQLEVKGKEVKPYEQRSEPTRGGRTPEKRIEKPTSPERTGSPKEYKAPERTTGKPTETTKPLERGTEKTREYKPAERGLERPRDVKPTEKGGVEKPREYKSPEGGSQKSPSRPQGREIERPQDVRPPERNPQGKQRDLGPAEGSPGRSREKGPTGRGIEKPKDDRSLERK
ncbi:MAG: hypothetical protein A2162_03860, partial [Deltaproteobacteria bacterium RBG_13_52_11b]